MTALGGKELWKTSLRECLPIWETPPGVASRWSQVGVFANLSGPARNPRTPLYYANTAKLFNKYNHSIDANTAKLLNKYNHSFTQILPTYLTNTTYWRKYWRFCKIYNQVDHFCNIWGKYVIFGANNDTRRSNQNSQPLLCDKYPLGNLKLFLFFPLFVKPTFFYYFPGVEGFHGELSWETRLPMRIELPPPSYNNQMDLRAETSDNWKRNLNFL